jgi:hypothetical protein
LRSITFIPDFRALLDGLSVFNRSLSGHEPLNKTYSLVLTHYGFRVSLWPFDHFSSEEGRLPVGVTRMNRSRFLSKSYRRAISACRMHSAVGLVLTRFLDDISIVEPEGA